MSGGEKGRMVRGSAVAKYEVAIIRLRDGGEAILHIIEHGATGKISSIKVPIGAAGLLAQTIIEAADTASQK